LSVDIVEPGAGPSFLIVSPAALALKARPGQPLRFSLSVKLSPASGLGPTSITGALDAFKSKDGKAVHVESALQVPKGMTLRPQGTCVLNGFVLAPASAGQYVSRVRIDADQAGTVWIPLTLQVGN